MTFKVYLQNKAKWPNTPSKIQFQRWAKQALMSKTTANEVTLCIVTPAQSAELNKTYRHKDGPTNVLSFSYSPIPGEQSISLGDLAICAELVEREAQEQHKTIEAHWAHLTVHGLLHLQGYDHEQNTAALAMENLETQILQQLGFPDPYHNNTGIV